LSFGISGDEICSTLTGTFYLTVLYAYVTYFYDNETFYFN
jgi:hypothetical protein